MGSVKLDMSGWNGLEKTLKGKFSTRVGILGSKAVKRHEDTKLTNAEIGAIHELGLVAGIPQRSFLKEPLEAMLKDKIASNKEMYFQCLENGDMKKWFQAVGFWAEEIVDDAFTSGGFGKWAPNAPSTIKRKGSDKPLINIGELRRSITSQVLGG